MKETESASSVAGIGAEEVFASSSTSVSQSAAPDNDNQETFQHLAALLQYATDAIIGVDLEGKITTWNKGAERLYGYTAAEIIGHTLLPTIPPDRMEEYHTNLTRVRQGETLTPFETERLAKDGSPLFVSIAMSPIYGGDGRVIGTSGIVRDVSATRQAAQKKEKLSVAVEQSPASLVITDAHGNIEYVNQKFTDVSGYTFDDVAGQNPRILKSGLVDSEVFRQMWETISSGQEWHGELINRKKNGQLFWEKVSISPMVDDSGNITHYVAIKEDVSERKHAEEKLRRIQANLARAQFIANLGSWELEIADVEKVLSGELGAEYMHWSDQAYRVLGYEPGAVQPSFDNYYRVLHPDDAILARAEFAAALRERKPWASEHRLVRAGGAVRIVKEFAEVTSDPKNPQRVRVMGTIQDITEQKAMESEIAEVRDFYLTLFEEFPGLIWQAGPDAKCTYFNRTWLQFTGRKLEQELGDGWAEGVHPDDCERTVETYLAALEKRVVYECEYRLRRHDGEYRWISDSGRPFYAATGEFGGYIGTCYDITERKTAQTALQESQRFLESTLNALNDEVAILDEHGYVLLVNSQWNRFAEENGIRNRNYGVGSNYLSACDHASGAWSEEGPLVAEGIRAVIAGTSEGFFLEYPCHHGKKQRWFLLSVTRFCSEGQVRVVVSHTNITERRLAEDAVRRTNDELEQRVAERTEELNKVNEQLRAELQERQQAEATLRRLVGERDKLYSRLMAETQESLQLQERLQLQFLSMPIGCMIWDGDFKTTSWNPAAEKIFGYSIEEALGRDIRDLVVPPELHPYMQSIWDSKDSNTISHSINENLTRDGRRIVCEWSNTALRSSDGTVVGMMSMAQDITERQRAEEEIRLAKEEAERANAAKSEFLSRMSHELRTPLNAILGFAQLLEMRKQGSRDSEALEYILKSGRHLLELINEVLDITRIEAGKFSVSPEAVVLRCLVQETLDTMRPLASARNITVVNEITDDDLQVLADQGRLRQVLLNLVSNAIKYNREGGRVSVSCTTLYYDADTDTRARHNSTPSAVRVMVSDTGPGFTKEELQKLFTPFERLKAEESQIEGTGIGLVLCKSLMEAMHGSIGVESQAGSGSTFWIELPLATEQEPASEKAVQARSSLSREHVTENVEKARHVVLYIEDNVSNLKLIQSILEERDDISLMSAMQGSVGLDLARQHQPDVILLDLHLPDLSGDIVLRLLRAEPATREIPVVILSADATPHQISRLLDAGAKAYLTKPLEVDKFLLTLDEVIS